MSMALDLRSCMRAFCSWLYHRRVEYEKLRTLRSSSHSNVSPSLHWWYQFRYLGVIYSHPLFPGLITYISSICTKIPQNPRPYLPPSFHCSSNPHTIIKLYSSLCTSDTGTLFPSMVPSFSSLSHKLESVQNLFAINIPSNFHCTSYSSNLPSLSSRRVQAHLKILFFISHNCFFFLHFLFSNPTLIQNIPFDRFTSKTTRNTPSTAAQLLLPNPSFLLQFFSGTLSRII